MSRDFPLTHICTGLEQEQPFQPSAGLALSLLWKYMHMFCKAPLAPDSSAKKEGEKCWKAELLGRAQMDASAEWLPKTPVPAASSLPLFSFPLVWAFYAAAFGVEVSAFQVCIFYGVLVVVVVFFCILRVLLAQSVFCYAKLLSPSTLQGKEVIQPILFLESKFQFEYPYFSDL